MEVLFIAEEKDLNGFDVFFDMTREKWGTKLNRIRLYGTEEQIIMAVSMVKGLIIANNYSRKYCKNTSVNDRFKKLLDSVAGSKDWNDRNILTK